MIKNPGDGPGFFYALRSHLANLLLTSHNKKNKQPCIWIALRLAIYNKQTDKQSHLKSWAYQTN